MREHTMLDRRIQETMKKEFPMPENVEEARDAAFAKIRAGQAQKNGEGKRIRNGRAFFRTCGVLGTAAVLFLAVCIADPAFAAQIPLVGRVFEAVGDSLGFSGDYSGYARPIEEEEDPAAEEDILYSQTKNGMTITLSEVYYNDAALYISMTIASKEGFPETMTDQEGRPSLHLQEGTLRLGDDPQECLLASGGSESLDGRFVDDHTFAGVIRCDIAAVEKTLAYGRYEEARDQFIQTLGITEQEIKEDPEAAYERVCQILHVQEMTDAALNEAIAKAGGPDLSRYQEDIQAPDDLTVHLFIPMVVGYKAQPDTPEMPEDLRAAYEQAMKENGLGLADADYAAFTDEQKEIEHRLFTEMWNGYAARFPETNEHPNRYENWWVEGPWEFSVDVEKNSADTVTKEINDLDENGLGLASVTKTPFEITVDDRDPDADRFVVALDADGDILPYGSSGDANTFAIQDRDVSRIDIYICDYIEYMDELKVYYWSEDYETKKKEKTFKQLLDERALYHREIIFD